MKMVQEAREKRSKKNIFIFKVTDYNSSKTQPLLIISQSYSIIYGLVEFKRSGYFLLVQSAAAHFKYTHVRIQRQTSITLV